MLKGKTFLITGRNGSFGNTLAKKLTSTEASQIFIFGRDKVKQDFMKQETLDPRVRYTIGDLRDEGLDIASYCVPQFCLRAAQ